MKKVTTDRSVDGQPVDAAPMTFRGLCTASYDGAPAGVLIFTDNRGVMRIATCPVCLEHLLQCLLETKRLHPHFFREDFDG